MNIQDVYEKIRTSGMGALETFTGAISDTLDEYQGEIGEVGKPCVYHESVDADHRISNFFRNRMSIIDLIPCTYKFNFSAAKEGDSPAAGILPQIDYSRTDDFEEKCSHHGLPSVKAIRMYTTDDTTASDQFTNSLKGNFFKSGLNRISQAGDSMRQFIRSADERVIHDIADWTTDQTGNLNTGNDESDQMLHALSQTAVDVVARGHRVSLPSIWNDSNYNPNFVTNIKLVSPYGHPASIKEFVIKPLLYLLLLASPETGDGVSYGHPFFLTLKAYGLSYCPLAMISNVTLRRGGSDSSFNIYRQPLSINVSLEFQYAVNGFAHHNPKHSDGDAGIFGSADQPEHLRDEGGSTALPTLSHIVKSLRPRVPNHFEGYANLKEARNTKPEHEEGSPGDTTPSTPSVMETIDDALSAMTPDQSDQQATFATVDENLDSLKNQQIDTNNTDTMMA